MNKMIEKFMNGEFVVNCRTEDQARKFIDICYNNGMKWYSLINEKTTHWISFKEESCYRGEGCMLNYAYEDWYKGEYEIITFDEFMEGYNMKFTKDMLKVGMLVEFKDDVRKVVMPHKDGLYLMGCESIYALDEFTDDLESIYDHDDDIMKVYDLPNISLYSHGNSDNDHIYSRENRELLWEREEVEDIAHEDSKCETEFIEPANEEVKVKDQFLYKCNTKADGSIAFNKVKMLTLCFVKFNHWGKVYTFINPTGKLLKEGTKVLVDSAGSDNVAYVVSSVKVQKKHAGDLLYAMTGKKGLELKNVLGVYETKTEIKEIEVLRKFED